MLWMVEIQKLPVRNPNPGQLSWPNGGTVILTFEARPGHRVT
jgi:hypothetical protein